MNLVNDKMTLRNQFTIERDQLQKKIESLYHEIKDDVLKRLLDLGLWEEKWFYVEDPMYSTYQNDRLYLHADSVSKYTKVLKEANLSSLDVQLGVSLNCGYQHDYIGLIFNRGINIGNFVKKNDLKIDTKFLDDKIKTNTEKKNYILGLE